MHLLSRTFNALTQNRYVKDPQFRDTVHRALVDPQYGVHQFRMANDDRYAKQYQSSQQFRDSVHAKMKDPHYAQHEFMMGNKDYAAAHAQSLRDGGVGAYRPTAPTLRDVRDHLTGKNPWQPKLRPTPLPKVPANPEEPEHDDFEPFPEPKMPMLDDVDGTTTPTRSPR